ncbi:MAG: fatty acyl-AMP ligase [bacterium]|nr:fatty acyl-AMP ligase [bacterium]
MKDTLASAPCTLPEALSRAAQDFPSRGIGILSSRGKDADFRTYRELHDLATDRATRFAALGVDAKEPVLIALPTSWDWLSSWFGLMVRGALPVASSAAGAMGAADAQLAKVRAVMDRIGARFVIGSEIFRRQAVENGHEWAAAAVITPEELAATSSQQGFSRPSAHPDEVAFLQLTSGSTGLSRAVMIRHISAIHNPLVSCEAIGAPDGEPIHDFADAMASWLPLYHDMGLIGCLLLPILTGLDSWLLRPEAFLARPNLWLEQLGKRGVTFAPSPNFGYQLCVERLQSKQLDGLDLSGWRAALTGAEMVRSETVDAFCRVFGPHGFAPGTFRPCYGLAEGTLSVTFDMRGEGARTIPAPVDADAGYALAEVVSNGVPIRDTEVSIRAPNGDQLGEDAVGELWIRGPGVFAGYYLDEEVTAEVMHGEWFATGDLGFLNGGELYLTGRDKDVLIIGGHNIMPDELERVADQVTGGGGLTRTAAFSVARGDAGEQAVLVVETTQRDPDQLKQIEKDIRSKISRAMGLSLADVAFIGRGKIPRTTSGKMRRHEVRARYVDQTLVRLET